MATLTLHECDSCGHEVDGWTKKELMNDGWKFVEAKKGRVFAMCWDCVQHYEKRWSK